MPGATFAARWASTASPIEEVMQKRSPKVATAHSMMCSAGASSSSAPTWETSSRSSSLLRPSVWVPRKSRARLVVAAVMTVPPETGEVTPVGPGDLAEERDREGPQARPALPAVAGPSSRGNRSCSPQ